MAKKIALTIRPLTPATWDDFAALFGERGACGGCWCRYWRVGRPEFESNKGAGNRDAMRQLVDDGVVPGIIGYVGDEPVAWCAVAPREDYVRLGGSRILAPIDDSPVWSISCLFVRKDHRRKGLSGRLISAAVDFVRNRGAKIVEGYPVEPVQNMADAFAWVGLASAFRAAGFRECARRSETRPIMRLELRRPRRAKTATK